jgi:1-acyl-sn-glycerol-3-phosphate acyltransferase
MLDDFTAPHPVQFKGHAWARACLRLLGWSFVFDGLPAKQGVIVVYPHTSNWDFVVGILVKMAIGIRIHFWAKHTLFQIPVLGRVIKAWGGIAVDRQNPGDLIERSVQHMLQARQQDRLLWIGLAPEGTRAYRAGWRSGFHRLAMQAQVPLGLATLDYSRQEVRLQHFMVLSGDVAADHERIQQLMGPVRGLRPQLASPIQPLSANATANATAKETT